MFLTKTLDNSMEKMDRCDMGIPANGAVAFSVFPIYFSFLKNRD
jgi:hypothetical protein